MNIVHLSNNTEKYVEEALKLLGYISGDGKVKMDAGILARGEAAVRIIKTDLENYFKQRTVEFRNTRDRSWEEDAKKDYYSKGQERQPFFFNGSAAVIPGVAAILAQQEGDTMQYQSFWRLYEQQKLNIKKKNSGYFEKREDTVPCPEGL